MGEGGDESIGEMKKSKEDKDKYSVMTRSSTRRQDAESTLEELRTGTEQLSIEGQSHPYSSLEWKRGSISVSFDDSKSKWYYTAQRKRVYIQLHEDPDEGDIFVMNNLRHRARKYT